MLRGAAFGSHTTDPRATHAFPIIRAAEVCGAPPPPVTGATATHVYLLARRS